MFNSVLSSLGPRGRGGGEREPPPVDSRDGTDSTGGSRASRGGAGGGGGGNGNVRSGSGSNGAKSIPSASPRSAATPVRQQGQRRKFSETDFMDSGMGRSHTSEIPFLGLEEDLNDKQFDEIYTEQYLLSKLNDAQRRLNEVRAYKDALREDATDEATGEPPRSPSASSASSGAHGLQGGHGARVRRHDRLFVASFRLPLRIEIDPVAGVRSSLITGGLGLVSAFRELLGRIPIRWLGAPGQIVNRRAGGGVDQRPASRAESAYDGNDCDDDDGDDTEAEGNGGEDSEREWDSRDNGDGMSDPGAAYNSELTDEERDLIEAHLSASRADSATPHHSMGLLTYVPIFPDVEDAAAHHEFCDSVLWQLFHYLPLSFEGERVYSPGMFEAYERVNVAYANALIAEWRASGVNEEDAMFWVHDIHLLLVPKLLRVRLPNARIGFFLHTPFPAGEVYRTLPARKEILEGMLGADLIGFHTYDYARHFLSACERLLGLGFLPDRVDMGGMYVHVGIFPFGIDTESFKNAMNKSSVLQRRDELRESLAGKRVIIGVDRLDFIKGIPNKLLAVEHFLEMHPEWHGRVVLLQVATPSRTPSEEYHQFRSEVLEMVGRINGRFGTLEDMPIHYREHVLTFEELCALYAVADVAVLTSLRDGMNLVSYEYVMCQKEHHGSLVLSEFTGAAHNLPGAILCNPWNIDEVGNAIHMALEMTEADREAKHQKMYGSVMLNTAAAWGVRFIDDLSKHSKSRCQALAKLVPLDPAELVKSYKGAKRRLLLLDYDGTLRKYEIQPELAEPSERLKELLTALASDPDNVVFIVTGRQRITMMQWFGSTGIGFAVEHGFSLRWPDHLREFYGGRIDARVSPTGMLAPVPSRIGVASSVDESSSSPPSVTRTNSCLSMSNVCPPNSNIDGTLSLDRNGHVLAGTRASPPNGNSSSSLTSNTAADAWDGWDPMLGPDEMMAMRATLQRASTLLRRIEAYTPASFISVKESALTWHFRDADPDFAFSSAQDARQTLDEVLSGSPMEVLMGSEAIHVRPRGVHKGAAVAEVLRRLDLKDWAPDWILAIGDDRTDEEMFEQAHASVAALQLSRGADISATTVTVGRKTTQADFFVPDVEKVISTLTACSKSSVP